jgi:hypothetical protein
MKLMAPFSGQNPPPDGIFHHLDQSLHDRNCASIPTASQHCVSRIPNDARRNSLNIACILWSLLQQPNAEVLHFGHHCFSSYLRAGFSLDMLTGDVASLCFTHPLPYSIATFASALHEFPAHFNLWIHLMYLPTHAQVAPDSCSRIRFRGC